MRKAKCKIKNEKGARRSSLEEENQDNRDPGGQHKGGLTRPPILIHFFIHFVLKNGMGVLLFAHKIH